MAPTPGILYVTMHPKPSLPPAQFHDWYNNEHGPTRLRLSWCLNGFRYRSADSDLSPSKPEWMAVYDIEDMHHLTQDEYTRLRKPPVQSQRERDTISQIHVDRRFYDLLGEWRSEGFRPLEDVENEGEANVVFTAHLSLHDGPEKEAELAKWYEEEHLPIMSKVAGWRRTRRFVTSSLDVAEGKPKEFLAFYEYAPENGLGGEEVQRAVSTPWSKEIYASVVKEKTRRTYNLYYTFGPAPRDLTSLSDAATVAAESTDSLTKTFPSFTSETKYPVIESYITTPDNVRLPYRLEGSPDPNAPLLVCINSILVDHNIWTPFTAAFLALTSNKYRILRFNTRGRDALPPNSKSPITIATLTEDIITLLDALRVRTASLIGVSLGGATALSTALTHPNRISAFIACDTNSVAPPGNPKAWAERIAIAEKDSASTSSGEAIVGETLAELTVRRWFVEESYKNAELVPRLDSVKRMVETNSLPGFKAAVNALYEYDFRPQMGAFEGKGAFLVGEGDGILPKTMKEMAGALGKGVPLEIVKEAGHLPMVEKPDEVAKFVAGFLEK